MSEIEQRIGSLERWNRRWRCAAGVSFGVLVVVLIVAAKSPEAVPEVLRAKRIEVFGPEGKPAIILSVEGQQSLLRISARGENHERSVVLGADEEGAYLALLKHAEAPLLSARVDDDGSSLTLYDGRQPSEDPQGIILRSARPTKDEAGGTALAMGRGWGKRIEAGLFTKEPPQSSFLLLGGAQGKTVKIRTDQETGKIEFVDPDGKGEG